MRAPSFNMTHERDEALATCGGAGRDRVSAGLEHQAIPCGGSRARAYREAAEAAVAADLIMQGSSS